MEKNMKEVCVCVCVYIYNVYIAESLCCTVEISPTL